MKSEDNNQKNSICNKQSSLSFDIDQQKKSEFGKNEKNSITRDHIIQKISLDIDFTNKYNSPIRWFVLLLSIFVIMGTEFAYYNPMPIETQLELYMSSFSFNFLFAAYSIPNIIAPLFAGLLVSKLGPRIVMIMFLSISLVGQLIIVIGSYYEKFSILLLGRIILGIGSECVQVSTNTIVSVWFDNNELSLALGISLAFPMLGGSINDFLTPIVQKHNPLYICFLIGLFMLLFSMITAVILSVIDKKQETKEAQISNINMQQSDVGQENKVEKIEWSQLKEISLLCWMVLVISGLSVGLIQPFMDNSNSFAQVRYGLSQQKAGVFVALPDALSAFLTPFVGIFIDKYPRQRTKFILLSFLILSLGHVITGVTTCDDCGFSVIPFILLGIAFSSWYSVIMPTIPLCVEERLLGTTFGLAQMSQHVTITISVFIIGAIKDAYKSDPFKGYGFMSIYFISLSIFCLCFSTVIYIIEKKTKTLRKSTFKRSLQKSRSTIAGPKLLEQ